MEDGFFRREIDSGVRLVGEKVPGRRSLALGVWLDVGSRDEHPGTEGAAHFIEHMVFKATENRSGPEIASSLEGVGGSLEAFTTKENTCFYARVLEDHLELAVDVLADLVCRPRFHAEDVEVEKRVILEEIRSVEDTPEELIGDLAQFHLWPGHIMGASILGTRESLAGIGAPEIEAFYKGQYRAPRVVISAAGSVDPDRLETLVRKQFVLPPENGTAGGRKPPMASLSTLALYPDDLSQTYLQLTAPAPSENDPARRPVQLMTEILGGGMSSRLFQTVRETDGLAYSVQSYTEHFEDAGVFSTALAVSPRRAREALERTVMEMRKLGSGGLQPGELDRAKAQVRGSLIMGLESLTNRMSHLARNEFRFRGYQPVEQVIAEFDAVTEDQVVRAAVGTLAPEGMSLVAAGPVSRKDLDALPFRTVVDGEKN